MFGAVINALGCFLEIFRLRPKNVRNECLRITIVKREPAGLDLHHNPVTRKLCRRAIDWKWSSARYYLSDPPRQQDPDLPYIVDATELMAKCPSKYDGARANQEQLQTPQFK